MTLEEGRNETGMVESSLPRRRFVGREEIRAPLKTPAWEARWNQVKKNV